MGCLDNRIVCILIIGCSIDIINKQEFRIDKDIVLRRHIICIYQQIEIGAERKIFGDQNAVQLFQ